MPADLPQSPDDAPPSEGESPDGAASPPRPRTGVVAMLAAAVLGVALGIGTGAVVGAPMLGRRSAAQRDTARTVDSLAKHGPEAKANGPIHLLDNMVLNPAESDASRFLLISVALQVEDETAMNLLKAKDAAVRDLVLRIVGARRVEELSDMSQRDLLRRRIREAVDSLASGVVVTAVYFPQFVIQ